MLDGRLTRGAFGLDTTKVATFQSQRTVLAVVHHPAAASRLVDVMPLLETDPRIQVVYTMPPSSYLSGAAEESSCMSGAVEEFLRNLRAKVVPWNRAVSTEYDLAVAAGSGMLERLHAPVLLMAHGAGKNIRANTWRSHSPAVTRPVVNEHQEWFVSGGRVIPSSIALPHDDLRAELARARPEAAPMMFVAGDPCFDRMTASAGMRERYRRALGVEAGVQLVVVSSTWGRRSLLGRHADIVSRVAGELPGDRYRIAGILHPNTWSAHSRHQIRSWHLESLRRGVSLLPPEEGWRATLIAADRIIGDYGSVTCYGAALGVPVLRGAWTDEKAVPGSPASWLGGIAPHLDWSRSLAAQLDDAPHAYTAARYEALRDRITSRPNAAAQILRQEMYRILRLPEPACPARVVPVPLPVPIRSGEFETAGQ